MSVDVKVEMQSSMITLLLDGRLQLLLVNLTECGQLGCRSGWSVEV